MINVISLINNAKKTDFYRIKDTDIVGVTIDDKINIRIWNNQEIKISLIDAKALDYFTISPSTKKEFKTAYREFLKHLYNIKKIQ